MFSGAMVFLTHIISARFCNFRHFNIPRLQNNHLHDCFITHVCPSSISVHQQTQDVTAKQVLPNSQDLATLSLDKHFCHIKEKLQQKLTFKQMFKDPLWFVSHRGTRGWTQKNLLLTSFLSHSYACVRDNHKVVNT